jgi:hypothetical protein
MVTDLLEAAHPLNRKRRELSSGVLDQVFLELLEGDLNPCGICNVE